MRLQQRWNFGGEIENLQSQQNGKAAQSGNDEN
jgi:hypothetical protein